MKCADALNFLAIIAVDIFIKNVADGSSTSNFKISQHAF